MDTGVLAALVGAVSVLATLLLREFLAPFFTPWYEERLRKAQARVQRRADQRQMIQNELEKGFEDLSGVRAFSLAVAMGQAPQFDAAALYALHEQNWGVWRPYLIEDKALLEMCEEYRALIRDLRVAAHTLQREELDKRVGRAEAAMSSKAREIVTALGQRGW